MTALIYDIETTGLAMHSKVHCIGTKLIVDGEPQSTQCYTSIWTPNSDGNLRTCLKLLQSVDLLVGFNSINFDKPLLETFYTQPLKSKQLDLYLVAKVMFSKSQLIAMDRGIPAIEPKDWGKYSLDTFGKRIGHNLKGSYSDWTKLTTDMVTYCKQDIEVTTDLYNKLTAMANYPLQAVIDLEHEVAEIIHKQEQSGFYFNITKARALQTKLMYEQNNIERRLSKIFKPRFIKDGPIQKTNKLIRRKIYHLNATYTDKWYIDSHYSLSPYYKPLRRFKSGKIRLPSKTAFKYFVQPNSTIIQEKEGEYQNIKLTKFEATDNQIKLWLKALYNFEFSTYTEKGNVRVDRDDLESLGDYGKDLRRLMKIKKDLSQIGGTDSSLIARCRPNGTITSRIDINGTGTSRFTSSGGSVGVNLSQIPSSEEFRELFEAPTMMTIPDELYKSIQSYS